MGQSRYLRDLSCPGSLPSCTVRTMPRMDQDHVVTNFGRKLRLEDPTDERRSERFEVRVSPQWLARLDAIRGKESRGSFVVRLVNEAER